MSDAVARNKATRKEEKALKKALETPEEKRLRRLAKKEAKEKKRKQLLGVEDYTNRDNPFGDDNLEATFIWRKKYEKEGKEVDEKEIVRENKKRLEETRRELELVKQRRLQHEREREERLEEMNRIQREKEMAHYDEFEKQEDDFHLKQAKLRSRIRIRDGREKPIDVLSQYYDAFTLPGPNDPPKTDEEKSDEEYYLMSNVDEPYNVLNGLRRHDVEDLIEDIKVYMELEKHRDLSFWKDMMVIVEDELSKLKNYADKDRREGINSAVVASVNALFDGKSSAELLDLREKIEKKISNREDGVDVTYWETVLSKLKAVVARSRLKDKYVENMEIRKERLKIIGPKERRKESKQSTSGHKRHHHGSHDKYSSTVKKEFLPIEVGKEKIKNETELDDSNELPEEAPEMNLIRECKQLYINGRYSPELISLDSSELENICVVDPSEDERNRKMFSMKHDKVSTSARPSTTAEAAFDAEAKKGMSNDEVQFSVEEAIRQDKSVMAWSEKYRPRKPRYFNRVHTGFEWNKYNQTHYDLDNPPPKIVQGYKFNLFYPELIDKSKTPKYTITPCPDNREFAIIRFSAGPPYEDIAFKIVNREWNYSHRSGFRSQFSNNILQLWFHFKRYRYRR